MAAMNLNTIYAVKELEHGLIGFSREYEKLVKNNLANNSKIEADCVSRITALSNMQEKEAKINAKFNAEAERDMLSIQKLINENSADIQQAIARCNEAIAKEEMNIQAVRNHADNYISRIERFVAMCADFLNGNTNNCFHGERGLRWNKADSDCGRYIRNANNSYDSIFSVDEVDLKKVEECLAKEVRFIMDYNRYGTMKKLKYTSDFYAAKGNIAVIMSSLHNYITNTREELSDANLEGRCAQYRSRIEECRREIAEHESAHEEFCRKYREKAAQAEASRNERKIAEIAEIKAEMIKNGNQIRIEVEKKKEENSLAFISAKKELKERLCAWLDENFSIAYIKEIEQYRSHISDYSDTCEYTAIAQENIYIRLGKIGLDYAGHPEMKGKLEFISWISEYYSELGFDGSIYVPFIIDFRDFSNMHLKCRNSQDDSILRAVRSIALRFFTDMKAGTIRFTLIDHAAQGQTFAPFMQFISDNASAKAVINQNTCTTSEHSEEALSNLENTCRNINSNMYTKSYANVIEYNEESAPNTIPINIIFVMDFAASLTAKSLDTIQKLIKHSKRCGFHFIFVGNGTMEMPVIPGLDFGTPGSADTINFSDDDRYLAMTHIYNYSFVVEGSEAIVSFDEMFSDEKLEKIAPNLAKSLEASGRIIVPMSRIDKSFSKDISDALVLPFALVGAKDIRSVSFGHKHINDLIIVGMPGGGKSNTLHVLIMSALEHYTPEEVEIYLLDYKLGVEAYIYSKYRLPHFKVISTTKDCVFGKNVVAFVEEIMEERTAVFTSLNCVNFTEYHQLRRKEPDLPPMPRVLLIIDELHKFVDSNVDPNFDICHELGVLIKTCLSYGIHLIFSTQMGSNLNKIDGLELISAAIVLRCDAETEAIAIGSNIQEAQHFLADDAGLAVYSPNRANPHDNQRVRVAYLPADEEIRRLEAIQLRYKDTECNTRINAISLDNRSDNPIYKFMNDMEAQFVRGRITIGENLDIGEDADIVFDGNMLLIGDSDETARHFCSTMMTSVFCENVVNNTSVRVMFIELCDELSKIKSRTDLIYKFRDEMPESIMSYFNCVQTEEAKAAARAAVGQAAAEGSSLYIFVFGMSNDSRDIINNLLEVTTHHSNIHVISWCNTLTTLNECVSAQYHKIFNHRIVFRSAEGDVEKLTMKKRDLSGVDYALYRNIKSPKTAREYAAYKNSNPNWQSRLTAKLNSVIRKNNNKN